MKLTISVAIFAETARLIRPWIGNYYRKSKAGKASRRSVGDGMPLRNRKHLDVELLIARIGMLAFMPHVDCRADIQESGLRKPRGP
jgi:hypothetical protein